MPARMSAIRPKAATASANHCAPPVRTFRDALDQRAGPNMRCATISAGDAAADLRGHIEQRFTRRQVAA